jgi:hypothetical protein
MQGEFNRILLPLYLSIHHYQLMHSRDIDNAFLNSLTDNLCALCKYRSIPKGRPNEIFRASLEVN